MSGNQDVIQQSVVIEQVSPTIGDGLFALKAASGEEIFVSADIFCHGIFSISARVFYRFENENVWHESYMKSTVNDRWEGRFTVAETGHCVFKIRAWIDVAATWQQTIATRLRQYQSILNLLPEGIKILEDISRRAAKVDKELVRDALRILKDKNREEESGQLAMSFRFTEWVNRYSANSLYTETQEFPVVVQRAAVKFSSWYTIYPRSAGAEENKHGTFKDVINLLPRIASLGFNVLHFPPIHPIGETSRRGKNGIKSASATDVGSVYAVGNKNGGHTSIHEELGSADDLKMLVKEAEKFGIELALDLSLKFSPDHPWITEHPDWFENSKIENPEPDLADSFSLNIDAKNQQTAKDAVLEIIKCWVGWGVKIIRVDHPQQQPFEWWAQVIQEAVLADRDLLFYAGTVTRPKLMSFMAKSGFAFSDSYFIWRNYRYELEQYIWEITRSEQRNFFRPIFWTNTNHINPFNLQSGHEPQHLIRFFLAATLSGVYGVYGPVFEHVAFEAFPGKEDYWGSEKYEAKTWNWEKETKLTYLISAVNKIRRENPALQQTNRIHVCDLQQDNMLGYLKTSIGNHILCVVNLDAYHRHAGLIKVPLGQLGRHYEEEYIAHDLITGARYVWKGEWNYIELDPYIMPFHLFRIENMPVEPGQSFF